MAFQQWRRFNFFDKQTDSDGSQPFAKLTDIHVTACTSGRGFLILGDVEGFIHLLNRQFKIVTFKAYELTVTHLYQLHSNGVLVSVGEDVPGNNPLVKVWNLDKNQGDGIPTCTRTVSVIPANKPSPVTALAVHENMNSLALGYDNGYVLLIKGDITRDRYSKQQIIHESKETVTGLAFRTTEKSNHLFVATSDNVFSYSLSAKDKEQKCHLDSHGCTARCAVLADAKSDSQFVIGRSDAVYFYQPDGRGPCFAFEGEKILLHWFRGYLVIVGKESNSVSRATTLGNQSIAMNIVTIYDIQNKFIAYSAPIPEVIDVISEWGSIYVLGGDNKLYHLQEKDTQMKLEVLFKKNLYVLAIELAKSQHYDEDGLSEIFKNYGDHLYSKGDHDGAIAQYIKTIGKLEASYVIRKFLDAQRIHNLTNYLQVLHKQGLASEDHTTLLLNCYTKLKDNNKLDEFIKTKDGDIDFDIEIAIKVCRQAGYYQHALYLAKNHSQHDWYLKIQIEDHKDFQKALQYISGLEFAEAENNMRKYGKVLINEVPEDTTELLKRLCTDYRPADTGTFQPEIQRANAKDFIHIFVNNSKKLMEFLEHMIKVQPNSCDIIVYNTLIELYLQEYVHETDKTGRTRHEQKIMDMLQYSEAGYDLNQVLVLCQMNNFKPGILYLYEKAKLYQQIFRYYVDLEDYENVINTCKKFGAQDPNLWIQALWFFSRTDEKQREYLIEVLHNIENNKLMPPLMVIDTLSKSHTATLGVIKDYIIRQLQRENQQISEDERQIQHYQEDTKRMREQIRDIKTSARIFKVAKCSACNQQLELPSVHFFCQHSYHLHCFESYSENDSECPACLPENRKVLDIIKAQEQSKDLHEDFHHQLERAEDGFSIVAEYFGRGVFNKVTLITDTPKERYNVANYSERKALPKLLQKPLVPKPAPIVYREPSAKPKIQPVPGYNPFEEPPPGSNPFEEYDKSLNPFED